MDTKLLLFAIVGTILFINSALGIPAPSKNIKYRFKRQSETEDDTTSSDDDLASRVSSVTDSSSKIIENLQPQVSGVGVEEEFFLLSGFQIHHQ